MGNIFDPSAAGVGTHLITYVYEDANGCVNSDAQEITVEDGDCTTGINTIEINESVKVYPNPSSRIFQLVWKIGRGELIFKYMIPKVGLSIWTIKNQTNLK